MTGHRLLYENDARGEHAPSLYRDGDAARDIEAAVLPPRAALERHVEADVCIVGAGYTGLGAALALRAATPTGPALDVVVLEAHRAGWGASGRNGGQLGSGWNMPQAALEKLVGKTRARALWSLSEEAKADVHALAARHAIELDYRRGIITAAHRQRYVDRLHAGARYLAEHYAHAAIETLSRDELRALVDSPHYHGGTIDRSAGHLNPLRFARGLAAAAEAAGAQLFERSEAMRIETMPNATRRVVTPRGSVRARHVVVACNGYLDGLLPSFERHVMPINNYVIATEPLGARAATLLPDDNAVADTRFVVNYFRRSSDDRLVFGGGESYGYRFPNNLSTRVRRAMLGVFPQLADVCIEHAWGGTLAITTNRLPRVRELEPGLYAAGGFSGHGVALSTMSGRAIGEAIRGERERFELLAGLPMHPFPGGRLFRPALLVAAMTGASWLDRM